MIEKTTPTYTLLELFKKWKGKAPDKIIELPPSGSERIYYRIFYNDESVIGAYNPNIKENKAFLEFTRHFNSQRLPVPALLAVSDKQDSYLITDLGDTSLYSLLPRKLQQVEFSENTINVYKKALEWLPRIQVLAGKELDYDFCYPRKAFDAQSMLWDLNYFKYFFLKIGGIAFDEQRLEHYFGTLVKWLSEAPADYFMFRDFQSRNIMVVDNKPWFIDYQGGRRGALQYDVASLLFDAKANVPFELRKELLEYYLQQLEKHIEVDRAQFIEYYYGFVLIRVFQALGTYGFRGIYEKKPLFMQSIPYAQNNLAWLIEQNLFPENLPHLRIISERIVEAKQFQKYRNEHDNNSELQIVIRSFSYKKDIPVDISGNGGGFVFDCRALPNPGRLEKYKALTGKDEPVVNYLDKQQEVADFINKTSDLVISSAKTYKERGFTNLMVCYGCTGGQHRSLYCAEKLAKIINEHLDVIVDLRHEEEDFIF